jgi:hypothetical protein
MKTTLDLRPVYHWREHRIRAHEGEERPVARRLDLHGDRRLARLVL